MLQEHSYTVSEDEIKKKSKRKIRSRIQKKQMEKQQRFAVHSVTKCPS